MNNGQRVRALREWAHRDESAAERQSRLERLVRAELELERDLDAPIRWRPIAEAPMDYTSVLVWAPGEEPEIAHWSVACDSWVSDVGRRSAPTHFAELKGPDHG